MPDTPHRGGGDSGHLTSFWLRNLFYLVEENKPPHSYPANLGREAHSIP